MEKEYFEKIYNDYYQKLNRYAFLILHDLDLADEAVQQVFFNIWEQRQRLQIKKIYPYLIQSTKNEALQLLKGRNTTSILGTYHKEEIAWQIPDESTSETFRLVKQSIELLPPKCKEIMLLKVNDGLTHKEIAEYLNISVKTIENQVNIAFTKIRAIAKNKGR